MKNYVKKKRERCLFEERKWGGVVVGQKPLLLRVTFRVMNMIRQLLSMRNFFFIKFLFTPFFLRHVIDQIASFQLQIFLYETTEFVFSRPTFVMEFQVSGRLANQKRASESIAQ